MHRRKILILILAAAMAGTLLGCAEQPPEPAETDSLKINGESVPLEEYRFFLRQHRALCYAYFSGKYAVAPDQLQWDCAYDGTTPAQWASEQAIDAMLRAYAVLQFPQNELPQTDFEQLYLQWQQQDLDHGGTESMDFSAYFDYRLSEYRAAVQRELMIRQPDLPGLLERLYRENEDSFLVRQVCVLRFSVAGDPDSIRQLQALHRESVGMTPEQLQSAASEYPLVQCRRETLSEADRDLSCENLRLASLAMQKGEVTSVIQNRSTVDFAVLLEEPGTVRLPFETARPALEGICAQNLLQSYLDTFCTEATVEFPEDPAWIAQQTLSGVGE